MKNVTFVLLSFIFLNSLSAVEYYDYVNYKTIDKDENFRIETAELRKWSESFVRIWAYNESMAVEAFPMGVGFLKIVNKDKNKEISKSELRDFQEMLKPVLEKAYVKFKELYDTNDNSRIEKSELSEAFIKHPHYFHYFNLVMKKPQEVGMERRPRREDGFRKPARRKAGKKLDDIYD